MRGLTGPRREYVGRFRGEVGLEGVEVEIAGVRGTPAVEVANELSIFECKLRAAVVVLDAQYPEADDLDDDGLLAVIELAAWAHADWVRIHPFANGNGRTARFWANYIFVR